MKVFMLGWEFPPYISGGLGTACYGLTRAMNKLDVEVTFVLPRASGAVHSSHVDLMTPDSVPAMCGKEVSCSESSLLQFYPIDSPLRPYDRPGICKTGKCVHKSVAYHESSQTVCDKPEPSPDSSGAHYGDDIHTEVHRYSLAAARLAKTKDFDVIHAHDWMTYCAGVSAAQATGKPLVIHVHSTEFDRSGDNVNQVVYDIERYGMGHADRILAVSGFTRNIVIDRYGIDPAKVEVVHNGLEVETSGFDISQDVNKKRDKIVLFLGRITMQKGPEYFLMAARKVIDVMENVKFIMAGSGDMFNSMVELAAELGIGSKVLFPGFLRGNDVKRIYGMADLFVMPSVSEPFGLVSLEALSHNVPVIISKQTGAAEVLSHVLKVDFWDVDEMANKMISMLRHSALSETIRGNGRYEVDRFDWMQAAEKCISAYNTVISD